MDPIAVVILLLVAALALVASELLLPSHGVLSVIGAAVACGAVVLAFGVHRWLGTGVLLGVLITGPIVFTLMLKAWERSPVGRRVTLTAVTPPMEHEPVRIGDVGRTISELRPMGEAEFGPVSVQVVSHAAHVIAAGTGVRVIAYRDGVATVEPTDTSLASIPVEGSRS